MNPTAIRLLELLLRKQRKVRELPTLLGIRREQVSHMLKGLSGEGYVEREGARVMLSGTSKAVLLRDVSKGVDLKVLLHGPNEAVLAAIGDGSTVNHLAERLGMSATTVYRAVGSLGSIGAVQMARGVVTINNTKTRLALFAALLGTEREGRYEDGNTEVIYRGRGVTLRRAPSGKAAKGFRTGFSLFSDYGLVYSTSYDYFCEQENAPGIDEILLHAVYSASYYENVPELTMAIIFYLKHGDMMDTHTLRRGASKLGMLNLWLDVEAYVRGESPKKSSMFLPRDEFNAKAEVYGILPEADPIPELAGSLFSYVGERIPHPRTVYVFGGENMRIKSLKVATKDCDAVAENKDGFADVAEALSGMGYVMAPPPKIQDAYAAANPSGVFTHAQRARVDLFTSTVLRGVTLSPHMMKRADIIHYGKLRVGVLRNEDVFLLKAMAGRDGDMLDMVSLVEGSIRTPRRLMHGKFDWGIVWDEILEQGEISASEDVAETALEQLSYFSETTGTKIPFLGKLRRHVVDGLVKGLLRGGSMPVREIVELLEGGNVTAQMIRSRIDALVKIGTIRKYSVGRAAHARLDAYDEYPRGGQKLDTDSLIKYLMWRFRARQTPTDAEAGRVAAELAGGGLATAGDVDAAVRGHIDAMREREDARPSEPRLDAAGAARACLELGRGRARAGRRGPPRFITKNRHRGAS